MNDIPSLLLSAGVVTGVGAAFAALLRANLLKDKILAQHMSDMLEAVKAGARADYAVANALRRIEDKIGIKPSNAGNEEVAELMKGPVAKPGEKAPEKKEDAS